MTPEEKAYWKWHMNPYPMKQFRFNDDFTIDVLFFDGKTKRYDIRNYTAKWECMSYLLDDLELFKHPALSAENIIRWDKTADITAEWLYEDGVEIPPLDSKASEA